MNIVVLDRAAMGLDLDFFVLSDFGNVKIYDNTQKEEVGERIADADIVVLNKVKMTEDIICRTTHLRLICVFATGFDNIDLKTARERGVAVCNVPAYSTESVLLFTVSTALTLFSHIREYGNSVADGTYSAGTSPNRLQPVYHELAGKTWGIIGCGHIGGRIAEVATALGAKVVTYQRTPSKLYPTLPIDELCRVSDIISVHCPLNDETRALINAARISVMKPSVILVNESRGAVLDEQAVANALTDGKIGAFGCDVYSAEPFSSAHPYFKIKSLPNVLLTPHAAWAAFEARERCLSIICGNINAFLNGERLNRVD